MYDVVIIGSSFAGMLTALTLKKYLPYLTMCIIDKNLPAGEILDQRATALSPSSLSLLNELDVWKALEPFAAPIHDIHIGMTASKQPTLVFHKDHQTLGYNLPNQPFRSVLGDNLKSLNVDNKLGSAIRSIDIDTSSATITLENNLEIKGRLVIGADGRSSVTRQLLTTTRTIDYHQTAFTGTINHSKPHKHRAFEFFIPQGALAFIPLKDAHTSTLVWSLKNQLLPLASPLEDTLSNLMESHLGTITCPNPIQQHPLKTFTATPRFGHRWVLVGDAANAIHPVAGQGMNLAIRDIQTLAHHLSQQWILGLDIGSLTHLSQYGRARQLDRYSLLSITHIAAKWMTTSHKLLSSPLEKGMKYLNHSSTLSDFLINTAQFGTKHPIK